MNILSTVMGLLLIFACVFTLSLRKATLSQGVEKTYQAHMNASRKIRNSYESLCYHQLRSEKKNPAPKENDQEEKMRPPRQEIETGNLACARLNLWPLVVDGIEKHLDLYEASAQVLHACYSKPLFQNEPRFEYNLLNAIVEAARAAKTNLNTSYLFLEKLKLKKANVKQLYPLQSIYYRMLRGTKKVKGAEGYPSLIDYFVIENNTNRVCLHHASPVMLMGLFGKNAGLALYVELQKSESPLSLGRLQEICMQNGKLTLSEEFIKLIDLVSIDPNNSGQKFLVKQDADVCLKQKVYFPS